MSLQLPNDILSPEDLKTVILEVRTYQQWFRSANIKRQVAGNSPITNPPVLSPASITLLKDLERTQQLGQESLTTLLTQLQELLTSSPQMVVTLAAPPTNSIRRALVGWCRKNISPNILVSFHFNATLLGGMVIQYGSRVFDWSFRRQILANRSRFPEVLRRV